VIHTARLPREGKYDGYTGPDGFDVTRSGADAHRKATGEAGPGDPFAPSWRILGKALTAKKRREAEFHWPLYVEAYRLEMRDSFARNVEAWRALLERRELTLLCCCGNPNRCHRTLLAEYLRRAGERLGFDVEVIGERT
jgi:hypothetical protein